jgi:hypothetical protein
MRTVAFRNRNRVRIAVFRRTEVRSPPNFGGREGSDHEHANDTLRRHFDHFR